MAPDPDIDDAVEPAADRPVCPECGHVNIAGAVYCSRCGHALNGEASSDDVIDVVSTDSQATSTFEPVTSTVTPPPASPWARPSTMGGDAGQTAALPTPDPSERIAEIPPIILNQEPHGPRGFLLGVLALLLILAVLAVYVYVAWLSDATRATIDGWLPWM